MKIHKLNFLLNIADIHLAPKNLMGWGGEGVYKLKGVWHEIFDFSFFSLISVPWPLSIPLGSFSLFLKIHGDNHEWMFISSVNDIADKFIDGVVDTSD